MRSSVALGRFTPAVSQGLNRDSLKTLRHSRFAGFAVVPYRSSGCFALLQRLARTAVILYGIILCSILHGQNNIPT
ncbi:MAG: hypothetical protein MR694_00005, partial [Spirochaetia bacterium]|nr:hypothetical protein [Spirochaetia bacterium]